MDSIRLPNLLQSNYKGLQLYTISDTQFSEKELFVNVIEEICSFINIITYTRRVTSCKLVAQLKFLCCQKRFENADQSPIIKYMNCQH